MARCVSFIVLVAALLINTLSYCSAANVHCVTPTTTPCSSCPHNLANCATPTTTPCSSCPHNSANCATLSEYAHDAKIYFTSNTTMVFLPGDHVLDVNITVANVARLTMHGESSPVNIATIVRNGSVGFSFTNMVDFNIYSLAFTSYNRSLSYGSHTASNSALLLGSTQNAKLVSCSFYDNFGTALTVHNTNVTLVDNQFIHNQCGCVSVSNNCKVGCGITALNSNLTFIGSTNFCENNASYGGTGAIWASATLLDFDGTNNFINNSANGDGGAIYMSDEGEIIFNGSSSFISNSAEQGGAISANVNSTLAFDGNVSFTNNAANSHGGALYLYISSTFSILPHTTVCWENNHANLGGAIFVYNNNPFIYCSQINTCIQREKCFFQLPGQNLSNGLDVQLIFDNNSADDAGSMLYGGSVDNCKLTDLELYRSGEVFDMLFHTTYDTNYNTTSEISSDPLHICLCKNDLPDCSGSQYDNNASYRSSVYPGEAFQISVVAVGQRNGTVSSTVRGRVRTEHSLEEHQTNNTCTKLDYSVFSLSETVTVELYPEGSPCSEYDGELLTISLTINQTCPPGFDISMSVKSCVCEARLADYTNQCEITNGVGHITRESDETFWVGFNYTSHELILNPHCPFDYCVNNKAVNFALNGSDMQCAHDRSGLLCGRCKEGYSLLLGSFHCRKPCSHSHLALLIPFALMGVVLVILLLVCKLTVATGTISGLVFYANIVGSNHTIFLPVESTNALSVFIAWLNLDLGIETCFYNGMDTYTKTWLQFVFPVYIWVLVALMILISHYSQRFAKLLGNNPVSVLATLILLSYAKLLRTFITVVTFTDLEYRNISITDPKDSYRRRVWLYDANIDYINGKHIPLFLAAMSVFLFLFLPYTFLLFSYQWLQAISHLKVFSWVNSARLKAFMDSHHAPYKPKHRYWPGLLLVLRFVLLLVFGSIPKQYPSTSINMLAILVGAAILQLWALFSHGVYKNWCLDALEGSFVLNLIILVGATMYININANNRSEEIYMLAVSYTSVFIALVTFIGIVAYHIFQQVRQAKFWNKMPELNMKLRVNKLSTKLNKKLNTKQTEDINLNDLTNDLTESATFDQLREPLLDDLPQPTHSVV